jgi:predicted nucleic acid-binding protein
MPDVIFDCCVLSNFALTDTLWIIKDLYSGKAFLTDLVKVEIIRGIQSGHEKLEEIHSAVKEGWIKEVFARRKSEKDFFEKLSISLGAGEASSIAVAKERGYVFASDDRAARKEAALLGVPLTGTIGILFKASKVKTVSLSQGNQILKGMIKHGFYSPIKSLSDVRELRRK